MREADYGGKVNNGGKVNHGGKANYRGKANNGGKANSPQKINGREKYEPNLFNHQRVGPWRWRKVNYSPNETISYLGFSG